MKNINQWLKKNLYVVLFLALEVFSIALFFRFHQIQESVFYNFCTAVKGNCFSVFGGLGGRKDLREENRRLHDENAMLRAAAENSMFRTVHESGEEKDDTLYRQFYTYIEAGVLHSTVSYANNHLVLDAGAGEGVEPGMAVIASNGIVGLVDKVSAHFCSVISILHNDSKESVSLASSGYTGSLVWPGVHYDEGLVVDIPRHIKVKIGERVVTSGLSLVYPGGITVGYVSADVSPEGANFRRLKIRFSEDYSCLRRVYIVKNLYKEELEEVL